MSGGTRLDRLLNLLDNGTTPATRKAAAQQIGEIQKYHPYDLQNLLLRLHEYLRNSSWETRIAAGQAIAAIASHVPKWDPEYKENLTEEEKIQIAERVHAGSLQFDKIDIQNVLQHGTELLASGGSEFDDLDNEHLDPKQRLELQRQALEQRMGISANCKDMMDLNFINDDDLVSTIRTTKRQSDREQLEENEAKRKAADIAAVLENAGPMSTRERNRMKRKAKKMAESKEKERRLKASSSALTESSDAASNSLLQKKHKTVITAQPQTSDKVVIEAVADADAALDNEYVWPFHVICSLLLAELFDPCWEVRHGASVGLREILKIHGSGAGKTANVSKEEQQKQNELWLEDCCIRFLCVFALDRFGDYVGDQVVVPVRETCAQGLGTIASFMPGELVLRAFHVLLELQRSVKWEVRHGSLLGLEYLIAVRRDLVTTLLPQALPSIIIALKDFDDDVRSVASETLRPVAKEVVEVGRSSLPTILSILWDILLELDDLTASTNSVMNLLAELYSIAETSLATSDMLLQKQEDDELTTTTTMNGNGNGNGNGMHPLSMLVPRLWPFLLHNIASVRLATLRTLLKLLTSLHESIKPFDWIFPILTDALCYVFQTIILETRQEVIDEGFKVWKQLLVHIKGREDVQDHVIQLLPPWMAIVSTEPNQPIDASLLIVPAFRGATSEPILVEPTQTGKRKRGRPSKKDGPPAKKSSPAATITTTTTTATASTATPANSYHQASGSVSSTLTRDNGCHAIGLFVSHFSFEKITQAQCSDFLQSLITSNSCNQRIAIGLILEVWAMSVSEETEHALLPQVLIDALLTSLAQPDHSYIELLPLSEQMVQHYQILTASMISFGAPNTAFEQDSTKLTLATAQHTASTQFDEFIKQISTAPSITPTIISQLQARRQNLVFALQAIRTYITQVKITIQGAMSSAIVHWNRLPSKLNVLINSLMTACKQESFLNLQKRFAGATALLIYHLVPRTPCPNTKIVKNICSLLYADPVTLPTSTTTTTDLSDSTSLSTDDNNAPLSGAPLARRGATYCLQELAHIFGSQLFESLPLLWKTMVDAAQTSISALNEIASHPKTLCDTLQLFLVLIPHIHSDLHALALQLLPSLFVLVRHHSVAIRAIAGKAIAAYCASITLESMKLFLYELLPALGRTEDESSRLGVAETIEYVIEHLDTRILPYLVFFIVPLLGRMSDQSVVVRQRVTKSFATLVRLMPLEIGIPDPDGFTDDMKAQKIRERRFLEQLLDGSKLDTYELPIPVNAQLRKYQQDGLNWLGFLQKYQLHGILCDDMGLGKTLQTLCIIVSDTYLRKQNPHAKHLPSMVVCPPTVTGHWFHETKKFFSEYAKPILYVGSPTERAALRSQLAHHDVVILSYDILRNDIEILKQIYWNYCALDEGHIIRNAKTKITQAAKQVPANHRLILSGTPIQNNVLELWSLFDFLMPGFLGTEKQFNQIYGKPILASKDPKCSAKDQEQGTIALEALHRQVLPFLLRRVKEDVLHDLPPKIIQDYYCELSDLQKQLYEDFAHSSACETIHSSFNNEQQEAEEKRGKQKGTHIFQALQYLRKLCNHPLLVLNAQHPEYNRVMKQLTAANDTVHSLHHAPKLLALKQLLNDCGIGTAAATANLETESAIVQHRVLIFAQLKPMLDIIENDLLKKTPSYYYILTFGWYCIVEQTTRPRNKI